MKNRICASNSKKKKKNEKNVLLLLNNIVHAHQKFTHARAAQESRAPKLFLLLRVSTKRHKYHMRDAGRAHLSRSGSHSEAAGMPVCRNALLHTTCTHAIRAKRRKATKRAGKRVAPSTCKALFLLNQRCARTIYKFRHTSWS